jgi:hypothetical protein
LLAAWSSWQSNASFGLFHLSFSWRQSVLPTHELAGQVAGCSSSLEEPSSLSLKQCIYDDVEAVTAE